MFIHFVGNHPPVQVYQLASELMLSSSLPSVSCRIWSQKKSWPCGKLKTLYQKHNNLLRRKAHQQKKDPGLNELEAAAWVCRNSRFYCDTRLWHVFVFLMDFIHFYIEFWIRIVVYDSLYGRPFLWLLFQKISLLQVFDQAGGLHTSFPHRFF